MVHRLAHSSYMKGESFNRHAVRLFQCGTGGDAAGKVGKADAVVRVLVLVQVGDEFHGSLR